MNKKFDAIVVGAGQAGPSLVDRLATAGMTVAIVERHLFGGTCVNTGCTPTKTLVASAEVIHQARRAAEYGIQIEGTIATDLRAVKARKEKIIDASRTRPRDLAAGHEELHRLSRACSISNRRTRCAWATTSSARTRSSSTSVAGQTFRTCRASTSIPYLTNTSILELEALAASPGRRGRKLHRSRVRADVSAVRQRSDGHRERARHLSGGRMQTSAAPSKGFSPRKGSRSAPKPSASASRRAASTSRRVSIAPIGEPGGRRLARVAGSRSPPQHRRSRTREGRRQTRSRTATSTSMTSSEPTFRESGRWATATAKARSHTPRTTTSRSSRKTCWMAAQRRVSDRIPCYALFIDPPLGTRRHVGDRGSREESQAFVLASTPHDARELGPLRRASLKA